MCLPAIIRFPETLLLAISIVIGYDSGLEGPGPRIILSGLVLCSNSSTALETELVLNFLPSAITTSEPNEDITSAIFRVKESKLSIRRVQPSILSHG